MGDTPRRTTPWELGHRGIPINGLVWMGDKHLMHKRIAEKLDQGFRVIKIKIGGIDFDDELDLIAVCAVVSLRRLLSCGSTPTVLSRLMRP